MLGTRPRALDPKRAEREKKHEAALTIGNLAILHRARTGFTQNALVSRMGTGVSTTSRLESGSALPAIEILRRMAAAFGGGVKIDLVDIGYANMKQGKKSTCALAQSEGFAPGWPTPRTLPQVVLPG